MAKSKSKARRGSDAESVTSTASNNSRTANNAGLVAPGSPRTQMAKSANGSHPKRKQSTSLLNKQLLPPLPDLPDTTAVDERQKKVVNFKVRTLWTFILLAGYFTILALGHMYLIALVTVIQIIVYKEVIALAAVPAREKKIPFFKVLNWYFLATTMFFLYGESLIYYFKHIVFVDEYFLYFAIHHRFISSVLYLMGFVFFVMTLTPGSYAYQFTQFCWTHMTLLLVIFQSHFIVNSIFEGLIWFFLPVCLVITNDIFAYICGMIWGRTPLIRLSPKKTVEGFIGGWICTIIIGGGIAYVLTKFKYMICPVTDLGVSAWSGLDCEPNPVFIPREFKVPPSFIHSFGKLFPIPDSVTVAPIQFHILVLATFASLIAPFGGFFASGLKRAFKIKDFGDSIPGHGGMTDRMDCQFIMGFFTHMYYQSFIAVRHVTVGSVIHTAVVALSPEEQIELIKGLHRYLTGQGIISEKVAACLNAEMK